MAYVFFPFNDYKILTDNYNEEYVDNIIETSYANGTSEIRPRSLRPPKVVTASYLLTTTTSIDLIENFWETITQQGRIPFEWKDARKRTRIVRFVQAPQIEQQRLAENITRAVLTVSLYVL